MFRSNERVPLRISQTAVYPRPAGFRAKARITFLLFRTRPSPPHVLHGVLCCPVPLHWSHSATCM